MEQNERFTSINLKVASRKRRKSISETGASPGDFGKRMVAWSDVLDFLTSGLEGLPEARGQLLAYLEKNLEIGRP